MYKCACCKFEKPLDEFWKDSTAAKGHKSWCKDCFTRKHTTLLKVEDINANNPDVGTKLTLGNMGISGTVAKTQSSNKFGSMSAFWVWFEEHTDAYLCDNGPTGELSSQWSYDN